jgi:histidinol-phosphate aminotransferase
MSVPRGEGEALSGLLPDKTRSLIENMPAPKSPQTVVDFVGDGSATRLLHLNESPYEPSPHAIEAAVKAGRLLNRYPDPDVAALTAELSRRTSVSADCIVVGAGLEDIIRIIVELFVDAGDETLIPAPSFPFFAVATRIQRGTPVRVGITPSGGNDIRQLLSKVSNRTRLAFCCTPNPPNGAATPATDVEMLAKELPDNIVLVLDEAYREFAAHAGEPDLLPMLSRHRENWVSLRTFSKAYALAGLRVGYALCGTPEFAQAIRKFRLAYSPTIVSQEAALAALKDDAYLQKVLDKVASERERLANGLRGIGLAPYPSVANFISVKMPYSGLQCAAELRAQGILVRDWRDPDYPNEIRLSVGTSDDTDACLNTLKQLIGKHSI